MDHVQRFRIETFVSVSKENALLFDEVAQIVPRIPGYMPGFIKIIQGNKEFLGKEYRTDAFFWWIDVLQLLKKMVIRGDQKVVGPFPGLAVDMTWERRNESLFWTVSGSGAFTIKLDAEHGLKYIFTECEKFLQRVPGVDSNLSDDIIPVEQDILNIRTRLFSC